MNLVSWNCRGVGGPRAVRSLCDVKRSHHPSVLGLVETKKVGDWGFLRTKLGFKGCISVDSRGRGGGLALLWAEEVDVDLVSLSDFHIDVLVKGEADFYCTLFYGNPRAHDRSESGDLMRRLKKEPGRPWIVMGDFNEITFSWEMESKRVRQAWQMRNFRECLEECELVDLGCSGTPFTFSNKRKGDQEVRARLDRMVANEGWRATFPGAVVKHGFAYTSDHVPLILCLKGDRKVQLHRVRRFEQIWLRHGGFKEEVRRICSSQTGEEPLETKLKHCMKELHQWNSLTFGSVKRKVKELKEGIQDIRGRPRTEETSKIEANMTTELDEWLEREELWWRQRSRADWLRQRDRNTAFFHQKASQRRRRNQLDCIKSQTGEVCETQSEIVSVITNYFHNIFLSQVEITGERWSQELEIIPKLVSDEIDRL
ncbi:unnamed protein product [Rhodiola kirilowii]